METPFKEIFKQKVLPFRNITTEYIIDNNIYMNKKLAILAMIDVRQAELDLRPIDFKNSKDADILMIGCGVLLVILLFLIVKLFT
jgi:hypothetical protein